MIKRLKQKLKEYNPRTEEDMILFLKLMKIPYNKQVADQTLKQIDRNDLDAAAKILHPESDLKVRSQSDYVKRDINLKLKPLVTVFKKIESLRDQLDQAMSPKAKIGFSETLQYQKSKAEDMLRQFIIDSRSNRDMMSKLENGIIKQQELRIQINERSGKVKAQEARDRLRRRTIETQMKHQLALQKYLEHEQDFARADRICKFMLGSNYQEKIKNDQRFYKIMNNKLI